MRMLIVAMGLLATTGMADAQAVAGRGPGMAGMHHPGMGRHWGGHIQGRWWGGWRAPGGWAAYRAPVRGRVLPRYWIAPQFYIVDWRGYGLRQPPSGYRWSRYYDDAVLTDARGSIADTVGGVDWDGYVAQDGAGPPLPPYGAGYDVPPPLPGGRPHGPPPPVAPPFAPPPPPGLDAPAPGPLVTSSGGGLVHSETHVTGGGYFADGYYYPPATTTTITIDHPDCGETTRTEYVTERVVRRPVVRRAAPTKLLRRTPSKGLRR